MKVETGKMTVTIKRADGSEQDIKGEAKYLQFELAGENGLQELIQYVTPKSEDGVGVAEGPEQAKSRSEDVIRAVNYAFNLWERSSVRQELLKQAEGPDKSINKMVKDLLSAWAAAGKTGPKYTEEKARAIVLSMWEPDESAEENAA